MQITTFIKDGVILNGSFIKKLKVIKDWEYTIEVKKPNRTLEQNALYWSALEEAELETWIDKIDLHSLMKSKFLSVPFVCELWEFTHISSTTTLSTKQFNTYIEKVNLFFLSEGIYLSVLNDWNI